MASGTAAALSLITGSATLAGDGAFEGLGDLAGGDDSSSALAVSDDGTVVVGASATGAGTEAFRWTPDTGMVGLGDLEGGSVESIARALSADGALAVGSAHTGVSRGALWSGFGPPIELPEFIGGGIGGARATGLSADGQVIAGYDAGPNRTEAYRIEGGVVHALGDLDGGDFRSFAFGISADGGTIVGWSSSKLGSEPFRWRDGTMIGLGALDGESPFGEAHAASADGGVIVGWSDSADGFQAFRWVGDGPMEGLGDLPGGAFESRAMDVRADGAVVVGWGRTDDGREALWWTEAEGPRRLRDVAEARGVVIPGGWVLERANAISADGLTIVGSGTNPDGDTEAWRLVLPPLPCPADVNGSGGVGFDDLLLVLDAWGDDGGPADVDGSGTVGFGDLLLVLEGWGPCV